ncbi:MAG: hypothetical protein H0X72_03295 [Acidobacteria bacterium]|jgi:hypothetical protein|nr:hypothetical protein [Acidobacteriota bacterium]
MRLFDLFKEKKKANLDVRRREFLHSKGRITDGTIIGWIMDNLLVLVSIIHYPFFI